VAKNLRITSAQPKIVDNESGLLIDFKIIATEVAGQSMTPSLTATFGDIGPGTNAIGRWLLQSTLQGLFTDYKASFEHLDALGGKKIALITNVEIHEMIRLVKDARPASDDRPDFLVNDRSDPLDLPDTLYVSDGRIEPVSTVTQAAFQRGADGATLQVQMTASLPTGWTYLRVADPGQGAYTLTRVQRSDGVDLLVSTNVWTTDRTFIGMGKRPIREHNLHLLDYDSTGNYTLFYEAVPGQDTQAPVSSMAALPASSYSLIPLAWSGADNAGGSGLAYFDVFFSANGGPFLPWLQRTTDRGAIFTGTAGNRYAFYSVATDAAGNREAAPATPQAETEVSLANRPPSFAQDVSASISEGETLTVMAAATDPDLPAQSLSYRLGADAPNGATIDPASGRITWPTGAGSGPSTNKFRAIATDNGLPSLSATGLVTVVVREVNTPPWLDAIADQVVKEGTLLTFACVAGDADQPRNRLTFGLGAGAPPGATLDSTTGGFRWLPTHAPDTNTITLVVTDNGVPPLSASRSFTVIVRPAASYFEVTVGSTNVLNGQAGSVPIRLNSRAPLREVAFVLTAGDAHFTNLNLTPLAAEIANLSSGVIGAGAYEVRITARPNAVFLGQLPLVELGFHSLQVAHSVVAPLEPAEVTGIAENGEELNKAWGHAGRVYIIAGEPLLEAVVRFDRTRSVIIYAPPQRTYTLQSTAHLVSDNWTLVRQVTFGEEHMRLIDVDNTPDAAFYRAY